VFLLAFTFKIWFKLQIDGLVRLAEKEDAVGTSKEPALGLATTKEA
jgi:hypothetical protein